MKNETSKTLRNGCQEGVVSCWTLSPLVLLWFGYPWTAPHRLSPPPKWGVGSGGTVVLLQGSPVSRGTCKEGPRCSSQYSSLSTLCETSNTRGANPNESIMEHMSRSIFGKALDTKSPKQFGCFLTKRRRDGDGGKAEPQGLQGLGCECRAPQPMEACGSLCPPPWPAAPPCPPRAASAALRGRECVGSGTTPRRAVC